MVGLDLQDSRHRSTTNCANSYQKQQKQTPWSREKYSDKVGDLAGKRLLYVALLD